MPKLVQVLELARLRPAAEPLELAVQAVAPPKSPVQGESVEVEVAGRRRVRFRGTLR